jgi:hypothetical protein
MSHADVQYLSVNDAEAVKDWPVGTLVRLKSPQDPEDRPLTRITGYLVGIHGGVQVRPKLEGFGCWNIDALEKA